MNPWQLGVTAFHAKFGFPVGVGPRLIDEDWLKKRNVFVDEELDEMETAAAAGDLPGVADGIVDAIYFLVGTAVEMGIDLDPLFERVHLANMRKEGGHRREDGKLLKPDGWTPPDIEGALEAQMPCDQCPHHHHTGPCQARVIDNGDCINCGCAK